MKSLGWFTFGALVFGVLGLACGYFSWGPESLVQGCVAFALTFVPAVGTLAWVVYSYRTAPEMMLLASLGGSGVRMAIALGGGILLTRSLPEILDKTFWSWLLLFYLGLLGFEITLLVRLQPDPNGSTHA